MAVSVIGLGQPLLSYDEAITVLRRCQLGEAELLGWDAFKVYEDGKYQPFWEHSIDLSTPKMKSLGHARRYELAAEFMQGRPKNDLYFEMVLDRKLNPITGET